MTIRLALIAAACLGAAGCSPSMPSLSGTFSSLRTEEPPRRTCRNVASDAVALSARASLAAGVPVRDPRIGEAGVTEVAWPSAGIEAEPNLPERMASLQAESDASGCALAFRESLPPTMSEITAATAPAPEPTAKPAASRSAWNAPVVPVAPPAPGARPVSARPAAALSAVPPVRAPAAAVPSAVPAPAPLSQAAPAAPVVRQAARPAPVEQAPRNAVRSIPITPTVAAPPSEPTP
jgi:hypothetical protein